MSQKSLGIQMGNFHQAGKRVTGIVRPLVFKKDLPRYNAFSDEVEHVTSGFEGHIQSRVILPSKPDIDQAPDDQLFEIIILIDFDTYEHLRIWLESRERKELLENARRSGFLQNHSSLSNYCDIQHGDLAKIEKHSVLPPPQPKVRAPPVWKLGLIILFNVYTTVYPQALIGMWDPVAARIQSLPVLYYIQLWSVVLFLSYFYSPIVSRYLDKWLKEPRPIYTWEPMHTLDSGFAIFTPPSTPQFPTGFLHRIDWLERRIITLRGLVKTQQKEITRLKNSNSSLIEAHHLDKPLENSSKSEQHPLLDIEARVPTSFIRHPLVQPYNERDSEVSVVAHYRIKWEYVEDFEEWMNQIVFALRQFSPDDFIGMDVINPQNALKSEFALITTFKNYDACKNWLISQERIEYLQQLEPFLESSTEYEFTQGRRINDVFTELLPENDGRIGTSPPPQWKSAALVAHTLFCVAWPIKAIILPAIQVRFGVHNLAILSLISSVCIVSTNTYLSLPFFKLLFHNWLYLPYQFNRSSFFAPLCTGFTFPIQVFVTLLYFGTFLIVFFYQILF